VVTLSIVMPAYNEAAHIEECVSEWYDCVSSQVPDSEVLVVDDCSSDGTGERLERLCVRFRRLRVLRLSVNVGHGPAVRAGLEQCGGEFIFQTDSDRQYKPEDFWSLWSERVDADFIFGVRRLRADGAFRKIVSGLLRIVNLVMWGQWIADANCPFKLMRKTALDRILPAIPRDSYIPMVVVSVLARRGGFRVRELYVQHFPRTAGEQSLAGLRKWAVVGLQCLRELMVLRLSHRARTFSSRPHTANPPAERPRID
jgi:dolichol-phosphate mannosyltransferase